MRIVVLAALALLLFATPAQAVNVDDLGEGHCEFIDALEEVCNAVDLICLTLKPDFLLPLPPSSPVGGNPGDCIDKLPPPLPQIIRELIPYGDDGSLLIRLETDLAATE